MTSVDSRQVIYRSAIQQILPYATSGTLDNILGSINLDLTSPLKADASSPTSLVVNVGATSLSNNFSSRQQTMPYVNSLLPTLTGGTFTFPSTSGGNIVASTGGTTVLTVGTGLFCKILLAIDSTGALVSVAGTPASSAALAVPPKPLGGTIPFAYVIVQNVSGTIANIPQQSIFQITKLTPNTDTFSYPLGLGSTNSSSYLNIGGGTNPLTGTSQIGVNSSFTSTTSATASIRGFQANLVQAAGITTTAAFNFVATTFTRGSGSTLTNFIDYYSVAAQAHPGTNNATLADNASFTGNYFLNQSGTDQNLLTGLLQIGGINPSTAAALYATTSSGVLASLNSTATSGGYIQIRQSGVVSTLLGSALNVLGGGLSNTDGALGVGAGNLYLGSGGTTGAPVKAVTIDTSQGVALTTLAGTGTRAVNCDSTGKLVAGVSTTFKAPTVQRFTSGTASTYTTPTSPAPLYLKVTVLGGGGGGAGAGGSPAASGTGGTSNFLDGATTLISSPGGGGGATSGAGGASSGSATINSPAISIYSAAGAQGSPTTSNAANAGGGGGGVSFFGGAGTGGVSTIQAAQSAITNSGSGGGGAFLASASGGGGGAAGAVAVAIITGTLKSTYTYTVGAAGSAGTGTNGGGAGASGVIVVEEFYQ